MEPIIIRRFIGSIDTGKGRRYPVEGVRLTEKWGAYDTRKHPARDSDYKEATGWCLIHLPTGMSAGYWWELDECQTVADWLEAEGVPEGDVAAAAAFVTYAQADTLRALRRPPSTKAPRQWCCGTHRLAGSCRGTT